MVPKLSLEIPKHRWLGLVAALGTAGFEAVLSS